MTALVSVACFAMHAVVVVDVVTVTLTVVEARVAVVVTVPVTTASVSFVAATLGAVARSTTRERSNARTLAITIQLIHLQVPPVNYCQVLAMDLAC